MSCKSVFVKTIKVSNRTTAETVDGAFDVNNINFPENAAVGSIHIADFDNGIYMYEFKNQEWQLVVNHQNTAYSLQPALLGGGPHHTIGTFLENNIPVADIQETATTINQGVYINENGQEYPLIPTWTTFTRPQSNNIPNLGFNSTTGKLEFFDGNVWLTLSDFFEV